MATIGSLVVNLGMNAAGYSAGVRTAENGNRSLLDSVGGLRSGLAGLATSLLAVAGIGSAGGALFKGVQLAAEAEQAEVAFGTLLGSAEGAKRAIADLTAFAAATPFQMPELTQAARQLIAFGVAQEDLIPTLRRVGDVSAGIGAPIAEIAEIYGKAKVQGRLFMEDVNQLTGRGIPIIGELAKQFGVSESAVRGLVEAGQVNFTHLEAAFQSLTAEGGKFGGMMEAQSGTLGGLWSTFGDNLDLVLREIAEQLVETFDLKSTLTGAIEWLGAFRDGAKAVMEGLKPFAGLIKVIAVAIGIAAAAWLAYTLALKAAAVARIIFNAVSNPASLVTMGVALAGAAVLVGSFSRDLEGLTAEAKKAAAGLHETAAAASAVDANGGMTAAFAAMPAGKRGRADVAGFVGGASTGDELVQVLDTTLTRMDEIRDFKGDGSNVWEWAAKPWVDGLDALARYEGQASKTAEEAKRLAAALRLAQDLGGDVGTDRAADLAASIKARIADVSGVGKEIAKAEDQLAAARGRSAGFAAEISALDAGALPEQARQLRETLEAVERAKADQTAAKAIADLELQARLLAGTATEADQAIDRLGIKDLVPPETLERIRAVTAEVEKLKDAEKLKKAGEQIAEQFRTPAQKLSDRMKELEELRSKGLIDQGTFDRAAAAAKRDAAGGDGRPEGPRAILRGSQDAFAAISARIRGDADAAAKKTAEHTGQMVAALDAANDKLGRLVEQGPGAVAGEEFA